MTIDQETVALLHQSLQSVLAEAPDNLAQALKELGWPDVIAAGADTAHQLLLSEYGRALPAAPALDTVAAAVLGMDLSTRFVWPYFDRPPGDLPLPCSGVAEVRGLLLGDVPQTAMIAGGGLYACELSELDVRPLHGLDPSAGWHIVTGTVRTRRPSGNWAEVEAAAARAVAAAILAAAQAALDLACDHVRARHQFGQAIGSYQSVRHRLAGAYATLTGARALLGAATRDGGRGAALLAKAAAGRAHDQVSREAIQVCGAIGLSAEFPLAGYVRRGYLLDAFLSPARDVERDHGQALLDGVGPTLAGQF